MIFGDLVKILTLTPLLRGTRSYTTVRSIVKNIRPRGQNTRQAKPRCGCERFVKTRFSGILNHNNIITNVDNKL